MDGKVTSFNVLYRLLVVQFLVLSLRITQSSLSDNTDVDVYSVRIILNPAFIVTNMEYIRKIDFKQSLQRHYS